MPSEGLTLPMLTFSGPVVESGEVEALKSLFYPFLSPSVGFLNPPKQYHPEPLCLD